MIVIGEEFTIRSEILGEDRPYWVYVPASYGDVSAPSRRYPVMVIAGGDRLFHSATGVVQFLSQAKRIPEMIVVAVLHDALERRGPSGLWARDMTPTHSLIHYDGTENEIYRLSGGGEKYLKFLRDELLRRIDETHRTASFRILAGHSLGGLLAVHSFLSDAAAFSAYIAIAPCMWWDDELMLKRLAALPAAHDAFNRALYLGSAARVPNAKKAQETFWSLLEEKSPAESRHRCRFHYYSDEDHGSVPLISLYDGLLFLFREAENRGGIR